MISYDYFHVFVDVSELKNSLCWSVEVLQQIKYCDKSLKLKACLSATLSFLIIQLLLYKVSLKYCIGFKQSLLCLQDKVRVKNYITLKVSQSCIILWRTEALNEPMQ